MCVTDGEACAVWDETRVRASKAHRCAQCYRAITPGTSHIRIGSLFEGHWETNRIHVECDAVSEFVRTKICEAEGEHGFISIGGLAEEIGNLTPEYGVQQPTAEDLADLQALGVEVEEDDGETFSGYTAVAEWVWDIARAGFSKFERPSNPRPEVTTT